MNPRHMWIPSAVLLAAATGCGGLSYNEGDNDDPPAANACAETQASRPDDCEE